MVDFYDRTLVFYCFRSCLVVYLEYVPLGETLGQRKSPWDQDTLHILLLLLAKTTQRGEQ